MQSTDCRSNRRTACVSPFGGSHSRFHRIPATVLRNESRLGRLIFLPFGRLVGSLPTFAARSAGKLVVPGKTAHGWPHAQTALAAGCSGQLVISGKTAFFLRHAGTALSSYRALLLRIHRGKTACGFAWLIIGWVVAHLNIFLLPHLSTNRAPDPQRSHFQRSTGHRCKPGKHPHSARSFDPTVLQWLLPSRYG